MASGKPCVGIEIEDEPVGLVDMVERHAPIVDLERADLHQREQALRVFDIEIFPLQLAARDVDLLDRRTHALHGVALEEAFLGVAFRATHEADRPIDDVGEHLGRDRLVIAGEVELGQAGIGKEHLVGIGECDAGEGAAIAFPFRCAAAGFC